MSKKLIRLAESDLHRIVNNVINEVYGGFNQFSDGDFASDGDPYELSDIAEEDELLNLSGLYNLYGKKAFIDDNEENPKIAFEVTDLADCHAIYSYLIYIGEKWKKCENCGNTYFKVTTNIKKYCPTCAKKVKLEQNKKSLQRNL